MLDGYQYKPALYAVLVNMKPVITFIFRLNILLFLLTGCVSTSRIYSEEPLRQAAGYVPANITSANPAKAQFYWSINDVFIFAAIVSILLLLYIVFKSMARIKKLNTEIYALKGLIENEKIRSKDSKENFFMV